MIQIDSQRIDAQAVRELAEWKTTFVDHVAVQANNLVGQGNTGGVITLCRYRLAASISLQKLSAAVQRKDTSDNGQKAD